MWPQGPELKGSSRELPAYIQRPSGVPNREEAEKAVHPGEAPASLQEQKAFSACYVHVHRAGGRGRHTCWHTGMDT